MYVKLSGLNIVALEVEYDLIVFQNFTISNVKLSLLSKIK